MARLGTRPADLPQLVEVVTASEGLTVEGLMTHLANADVAEAEALTEPLRLFAEARAAFARAGIKPARLHVANSAALLRDTRTHFNLVRPGIALFGVDPTADLPRDMTHDVEFGGRFKPTMSVHSRIVSLRYIEPGDKVGYGGTFVATRPSVIATVPMGYADGLPRLVSNRAEVLLRGRRAPIIGSVSMDMTMIDATDIVGVGMGDDVVFLGHQKGPLGEDTVSPVELAKHCDSIPWEVLTNISRRVPRFYREA